MTGPGTGQRLVAGRFPPLPLNRVWATECLRRAVDPAGHREWATAEALRLSGGDPVGAATLEAYIGMVGGWLTTGRRVYLPDLAVMSALRDVEPVVPIVPRDWCAVIRFPAAQATLFEQAVGQPVAGLLHGWYVLVSPVRRVYTILIGTSRGPSSGVYSGDTLTIGNLEVYDEESLATLVVEDHLRARQACELLSLVRALVNEDEVLVVRLVASGRVGRHKRGRERACTVQLAADGLSVLRRRRASVVPATADGEACQRAPAALHAVQPCRSVQWVCATSLRLDDEILDSKPHGRGWLYAVKRPRRAHLRGAGDLAEAVNVRVRR